MPASLTRAQAQISNAEALQLAQQAPTILRKNPKAFSSSPLSFLFTSTESIELWTIYENLLLSCLRSGDDEAAHQCMERLVTRFGNDNERIMALTGLVKEAQASNHNELEKILAEYGDILKENTANIPITKRRAALLRSMGKTTESIAAINSLLEFTPTDAEAWAELADLYLSQGLYAQSIHALEEVVVLTPNAWNIHARLGEIMFMAANQGSEENSSQKYLAESIKRFSRSIELCDDYLRGYYGLKTVTDKLLSDDGKSKNQSEDNAFQLPAKATIEKLNQVATAKLAEIVRRSGANEPQWQGYNEAEIAAARALLDKSSDVVR
ncbi:hypothetical protein S40293_04611 [Stachybotrys chartarum IBT 40293]|nr:hypothetical protein S40293_04611 [Stachybotrys chartarum IBT 40293]KFA75501.1 hypothetical protein S40288_01164 [Stachybotrys chartarum IBT 40288]